MGIGDSDAGVSLAWVGSVDADELEDEEESASLDAIDESLLLVLLLVSRVNAIVLTEEKLRVIWGVLSCESWQEC